MANIDSRRRPEQPGNPCADVDPRPYMRPELHEQVDWDEMIRRGTDRHFEEHGEDEGA